MTYPCAGITRIRFHGYNLSLNTCPSTPRIARKGKQKSGKCQTSAAFFALFKQKLNTELQSHRVFLCIFLKLYIMSSVTLCLCVLFKTYLLTSNPLRFGRLYER